MKAIKFTNIFKVIFSIVVLLLSLFNVLPAFAGDEPTINSGDTAWIIVATALVMVMTPAGLALFYGGMSRYKNLLNTFAMTFMAYCIGSIVWVLWGYTLAFGPDVAGVVGGFDYFMLSGITPAEISGTIPTLVFVLFQMTFACITGALVLGSVVDRIKFSSWLVFMVLWITLVYCPVAHWVWGGGWMHAMGALDFAGGNVVHINAGIAGLVLAMVLGKRVGYGTEAMFPSSITLTALGAALLWFGWFGFNAGSQLAADGVAASAFLVTNTAAAAGAISWMAVEWVRTQRPTLLGIASGVVAGLVAITPAAGFVNLPSSIAIGAVSGIIGFFSVAVLKKKMGYDDSLDAFGVHGVCGVWGAIATGIFADPSITEGVSGALYGNVGQVWIQLVSVIATAAYSAVATLIVIFITKAVTSGLRVDKDDEVSGLDSSIHGERAFEIF
ncbi:ammonium transport protein (Amt family) [Desulfamplus magnetovallimortis]|uniref:Ammonium transporter n=1 Tax=Desulfamplus magnetovallimortis TaxID=1246637 RepID=A0A1W1H799_9BACT|nr:ammonium transporter [Desulfamplus magnetovallimortis]SLM28337.1 ammonium transport protein (Amt family) [Desulfamplus magnetovallimortis]